MRVNARDVLFSTALLAGLVAVYALTDSWLAAVAVAVLPFAHVTALITIRVALPELRQRRSAGRKPPPRPL